MRASTIKVSYRALLTRRFVWLWAVGILIISAVTHLAVRSILLQQVDRSLSLIASLQASAVVESPPQRMELREWELQPEEIEQLQDVLWFIQVWDETRKVVTRSANLTQPLPDPGSGWRAIEEGRVVYQTILSPYGPLRQTLYPLQRLDPAHADHVIQVAVSLGPVNQTLNQIDIVLISIGFLGLLTVIAIGWNLATRAIRPVEEIVTQTREIHSPEERKRITAYGRTYEFASLVEVLNEMLDRLEKAFDSQQRFTADASHELRTPMTSLRGTIEVALRRTRSLEDYREVLQSSLEEVIRMQALVGDLLILARKDTHVLQPRREPVSADELIFEVTRELAPAAENRSVVFETGDIEPVVMLVDRDMIRRCLTNLVSNAVRHSPEGGRVAIQCTESDNEIVLGVQDEGEGVPESIRPNIFDRFYKADSARTAGEGAGLGLSLVKAMVEAHSGRVTVDDAPGGGALFQIHLSSDVNKAGEE